MHPASPNMRCLSPIRLVCQAVAILLLLPALGHAQPLTRTAPQRPASSRPMPQPRPDPRQHLGEWMSNHHNMTLAQQQQALEREPGFQSLKPEVQQRVRERLTQLNAMPAAQREKVVARTEAMERLSVPQRQQVRGAMQQLAAIPPDRRRVLSQTFRDIRDMPPNQRQAYMNSEWYRGEFNEQERSTLSNLIAVEPLLPR
jgi:hypothetical protein